MNNTTTSNGPLDEGIEFFISNDSELQVSRLAPFASTVCGFGPLKFEIGMEIRV